MIEYLFKASPIIIPLIIYFVRLERRLAVIITDIDWIKTFIISNTDPDATTNNPGPKGDLPKQSRS